MDANLSVQHCSAPAFIFGTVGVKEFADACVHDPAGAASLARTTVPSTATVVV